MEALTCRSLVLGARLLRRPLHQWVRLTATKATAVNKTTTVLKQTFVGMRENVFTYPNGLSLLRIVLTPVLSFCILHHYLATSLCIFVVASATDLLDGYIARTFPAQRSVLGSVLDPLADKLLVTTLFLSLTSVDLIPGKTSGQPSLQPALSAVG